MEKRERKKRETEFMDKVTQKKKNTKKERYKIDELKKKYEEWLEVRNLKKRELDFYEQGLRDGGKEFLEFLENRKKYIKTIWWVKKLCK